MRFVNVAVKPKKTLNVTKLWLEETFNITLNFEPRSAIVNHRGRLNVFDENGTLSFTQGDVVTPYWRKSK